MKKQERKIQEDLELEEARPLDVPKRHSPRKTDSSSPATNMFALIFVCVSSCLFMQHLVLCFCV